MANKPDRFLNSHPEPRPAWERTIERLEWHTLNHKTRMRKLDLAERAKAEVEVMRELAFRVIGTEISMTVENVEAPQKMLSAVDRLHDVLEFTESREFLSAARSWIVRTYL